MKLYKLIVYFIFGVVFSLPLISLVALSGQAEQVDPQLLSLAQSNTFFLASSVCLLSLVFGYGLAGINHFYEFKFKKFWNRSLMLPLAFPAYVLAFIYLGVKPELPSWVPEFQGELWFLVLVLSFSLMPYVYYFASLGFKTISQNEWETEKVLGAGAWRFFSLVVLPKTLPLSLSAVVLVCFECLSDFGAASMINVPVMTTMIYKLWFDLFSFGGAVALSLSYLWIIAAVLLAELFLKWRTPREERAGLSPVRPEKMRMNREVFLLGFLGLYCLLVIVFPLFQILSWCLEVTPFQLSSGILNSLYLGIAVGLFSLVVALVIHFGLKGSKASKMLWLQIASVGYGIPGSVLAVAIFALIQRLSGGLGYYWILGFLVLALAYKFLTVALRPIGEAVDHFETDLEETSDILGVSAWRRWRFFYWPKLKDSCLVVFLLLIIEVMKEMPLTLMLAPSGYQTLAIQIFNFTSEGEWQLAAYPSLVLVGLGFVSVLVLNRRGELKE